MTPLSTALQRTPRPLLLFIGRQRGLRYSSNLPKADLLNRLALALAEPANLQNALARLAEPEQQVLTTLLAGSGRLARRYLSPRYGQLRPLRFLPKISQREAEPLSPLERLLTLGLIFYDPSGDDLFIPTDLIPWLKEHMVSGPIFEIMPGAATPQPKTKRSLIDHAPFTTPGRRPWWQALHYSNLDLLCHDLALLLALLHRDDVQPLHGRWLPPRTLAAWGRRCLIPPAFPQARSELQTGRRRFLHYLAENAGLVRSQRPVNVIKNLSENLSGLADLTGLKLGFRIGSGLSLVCHFERPQGAKNP